ncbi:MAG: hypothetical protein ABSD31_08135 [Candidatus Binataceae bacterium]|jgi:hypothetical protein
MASGDFELTIVLSAIDDASTVLQTVADEIVQDFNLISEQAKTAEADIDSVMAVFGSFGSSMVSLQADIDTALASFGSFDTSLVALQQDALTTIQSLGQLTVAMGTVMGASDTAAGGEGGGSMSGFNFLSGDVNPLSTDLSGLSQQSDVAATQATPAGLQLVQNNTFNGILDPSTIRDQIIPELELAVTRGASLLTSA